MYVVRRVAPHEKPERVLESPIRSDQLKVEAERFVPALFSKNLTNALHARSPRKRSLVHGDFKCLGPNLGAALQGLYFEDGTARLPLERLSKVARHARRGP